MFVFATTEQFVLSGMALSKIAAFCCMTLFVQYFSHHWAKGVNYPIIKISDGRSESYKLASSVTEAVK